MDALVAFGDDHPHALQVGPLGGPAARGWRDCIARKAADGRELGPRAQARSTAINCKRSRVEHVFAQLHHLGRKVVRVVGLARNELAIVLKCVAYNAQRLVWVEANAVRV